MRALSPTPSGAWPDDMEIRVSVNDDQFLELLYLRECLSLPTTRSWPALSPPAARRPSMPELENDKVALWVERWEGLWERTWNWIVEFQTARHVVPPHEVFAAVGVAPRWTELYGDDCFDRAAFESWKRAIEPPLPTWPSPERVAIEALTVAWARGFHSCYVLPFVGQFAQQVGEHALILSPDTRNDADEYSRVLMDFSPN